MLEKYYIINQAVGVNIHIMQNGVLQISACQVVVENNQLSFEKKVIDLVNIEELKKHFPAKSFVSLNLSGKGILQKQLERTEKINQHNFSKVLPNGNIDDFYIQNFISGGQSFVSVIRKTEADKWISHFKELGFIPLQFSFGPFPVNNIIPQLNIYDNMLTFNGHCIEFDEKSNWSTYNYSETAVTTFSLKVDSEVIDEKLLVAYAAAFQLISASKVELVKAAIPALDDEFSKLLDKKKFQVKSAMILCVLFTLLLINFVLFSWFNSSNAKLAEQVSRSTQSNVDIQTINDQLKQKEKLLRDLGWESGINKSALVDQLASILPEEVTWNEISVDPINVASSRIQKSLMFFDRQIRITGTSEKIIPVNEWIARVKTKPWVKNIQMDSYTYNSELNTGQFTVIVIY